VVTTEIASTLARPRSCFENGYALGTKGEPYVAFSTLQPPKSGPMQRAALRQRKLENGACAFSRLPRADISIHSRSRLSLPITLNLFCMMSSRSGNHASTSR